MPEVVCQSIATLTLNPTVDISYEIPHLLPDKKNHATATRYDPGGNGINVARALKELLVCAHSSCVIAGEIGHLLQKLLAHQLDDPHCIEVEGETRINCTILQANPPAQFEVDGIGPYVSPPVLADVRDRFLALCDGGIGVLTGSVPPGVESDFYGHMVERIQGNGGRAVVDAHGPLLARALPHNPFLIKPNRYEMEQLRGRSLPRMEDVAAEARALQREGVTYVCVSLGCEGALLVGPEGGFFAPAPKVAVKSTVGAGDSMVAGLIAGFAQKQDPSEALRLGVACGSGTTTKPGTALFSRGELPELLRQVKVYPLDI